MEEEGSDLIPRPGDTADPSVLGPEAAREFLELEGRVLLYANDRFDVVPGIDTYEKFERSYIDELRPIHRTLYQEENAVEVIEGGEEYSGEYFIYDWLGLSTEATADCLDLFH